MEQSCLGQRHGSALPGSRDGSLAAPGGGGGAVHHTLNVHTHRHAYIHTVHIELSRTNPLPETCLCGVWTNLPSQSRDKLLKRQAALSVCEDGADVLLSWGHIQDCHLVNLSAREGRGGQSSHSGRALHSCAVCLGQNTHTVN